MESGRGLKKERREYCSAWALSAECRKAVGAGSISRQGGRHGRGILFGFFRLPGSELFGRVKVVQIFTGPSVGTGEYEPRLGLFQTRRFTKAISDLPESGPLGQFHDAVVVSSGRHRSSSAARVLGSRSASLPGKQYVVTWKVDTANFGPILIFCRRPKSVASASDSQSSSHPSWVIHHFRFHTPCKMVCFQVLRYGQSRLFLQDSMLSRSIPAFFCGPPRRCESKKLVIWEALASPRLTSTSYRNNSLPLKQGFTLLKPMVFLRGRLSSFLLLKLFVLEG